MAETSNLTLNALLNVAYGTFTRGQEFQKAIEKFMKKGASDGAKAGAAEAEKKIAQSWGKVYSSMKEAGLKKEAAAFRKEVEERQRNLKLMGIQMRALTNEIKKAEEIKDEALRDRLKEEREDLKGRLTQEKKARDLSEDVAKRSAQERLKLIEGYEEKINKTRAESMSEAGENVQSLIKASFSADNLDLENLTETLTKGLAGLLESKAGALGAAGGAGSPAFAQLAEAATVLTAAIGPLAALAGVLSQAYNQTKDMNKELLEASSMFDLVGSNFNQFRIMGGEFSALTARLAVMRNTIQDVAFDMRLSGDEVMGAVKALAEAGITFREFTEVSRGAGNQFASFEDVMRSSISAAYGLGLEVSAVSEYYGKMSADLGYNLEQIEGSFGLISEQAQLAGMRTKDFFTAINESATGMALYNFRIGDTATLLTELVGILGEDLGKQKLGLEGTFRGMGMQDKYKETILGGKPMEASIRADMKVGAEEFSKKIAGTAGAKGLAEKGLLGAGGGLDTKKLANMSGKAFREALETSGLTNTQKSLLENMRTLSQAEKGKMGQAEAMGAMSRRGELAAQMSQGSAMFGGKLLTELHGVERMMAEQVTGRSGEEYDTLARLQERMMAEFEQMKKANDPRVQGQTFEEAVVRGILASGDEDVDKMANKKHFTEVEQAAREQLKETRSISQTMTNVIQQLLGRIALGIELLSSFFATSDADVTRVKQTTESITRQESLEKAIEALGATITEKQSALESSLDPEEKAQLQQDLDAAKKAKEEKKRSLLEESDIQRGLARGQTLGQIRGSKLKEEYGGQLGTLTPQQLKASGLGRLVKTDADWTDAERVGGDYESPTETVGDLSDLTEEEKKKIEELLEQNKQHGIDDDIRYDESKKITDEDHKELIKTLQNMDTMQAINQLSSYLNLSQEQLDKALKGDAEALAAIGKALDAGENGRTEAEALLLARTHWIVDPLTGGPLDPNMSKEPEKHDFIYRGDGARGSITPINSADQFYGAKPGGPIDQALSGGGKTVVININGADETRTYNIVKKVLLETGYDRMKTY